MKNEKLTDKQRLLVLEAKVMRLEESKHSQVAVNTELYKAVLNLEDKASMVDTLLESVEHLAARFNSMTIIKLITGRF